MQINKPAHTMTLYSKAASKASREELLGILRACRAILDAENPRPVSNWIARRGLSCRIADVVAREGEGR